MPRFFIDRPIFAWVISLFVMLAGCLAIMHLPVAQYPSVAPPSISITANYAGASAATVQDTVTTVIEQQMNGLDHLLYLSSSSSASGQSTVTLYFEPGTDLDVSQVQVQNKLQLAIPNLPATVQQQGIVVAKSTRNFLMFFALSSTNASMDDIALGNYISSTVLDPVSRVTGVGEADLFGTEYAMRIWLNPQRLEDYSLTASDVAGYEQQLAQARDNLVLLIGRPLPDDLPAPQPFNLQVCLSDIPAGLPSDLLERRPDVRAAEHRLEAANANIGAARAAFFPTVTLTGSGGTASTTLEGLFAPGTQTWAISPQIVWPIFAAGTAWNELKAIKASKSIEVATYQKAVQTAFREVADALAAQSTMNTQLDANHALLQALQQTYQLTEASFRSGVDSALDVAAAQQNLDTARQNLIQSRYSRLFNLINLYQALGGGWK